MIIRKPNLWTGFRESKLFTENEFIFAFQIGQLN